VNAVPRFTPGNLVRARGREWVVLPGSDAESLNLRPLSGSEADAQTILPEVEIDPVLPATFPAPDGARVGTQDEAQLLRDAFRLALRRGAGPFRSAGRVVLEPKAYQLVPLMMALKLDTVRLLIADDVGIGKTIEAGLIARELLDRGEIERLAVLCPPHLVDQWVQQLSSKFLIPAVAVTASSAARLERALPQSDSIFRAHPFTVVSLDYIKSDVRRDEFARACPEFVIVDEAHTCVAADDRTHLRYKLLASLATDADRHLVLLTATPHSGIADAFHKLLGLLDKDFLELSTATGQRHAELRSRLAAYFVQRRRVDIDAWKEGGTFPKREEDEKSYVLSGEHQEFLERVLDYCTEVVEKSGSDETRQRLAFFGTLALMRCVGSSPAAALRALNTRADREEVNVDDLFDGAADSLGADDVEPAIPEVDDLAALIDVVKRLADRPEKDPKFALLVGRLKGLLEDGFSPIVFCRYISTAQWVGDSLRKLVGGMRVEVIHGELPADERRARIETMDDGEQKILVATDCLSEGIDLQEIFDAVVHYDLCWNPTRHQQREGRVDRFGQPKDLVRSLTIYGKNNPIDGVVLEVIIRKARIISRDTGVPVAFPEDARDVNAALMRAMLTRRRAQRAGLGAQGEFDFAAMPEAKRIETSWKDAAEREKANRTIFAQRSLKPEEVLAEWSRTVDVLGDGNDTARFFERSMRRLGVPFTKDAKGYSVEKAKLPDAVVSRIDDDAYGKKIRLRLKDGSRDHLHRNHPLIGALAELLTENALDPLADSQLSGTLSRAGAWATGQVPKPTLVVLTRVRHCLTTTSLAKGQRLLLAEETDAMAFDLTRGEPILVGADATRLVESPVAHETGSGAKSRQIADALKRLDDLRPAIEERAALRAAALATDHARVRSASKALGAVKVSSVTPVDVIGVYSLMPTLD
jgi:superfamily II DNA or RNA helicase